MTKTTRLERNLQKQAEIRMYAQALNLVANLSAAERYRYVERLDKLRPRAKHVGWGVPDELNDLWHTAGLDEAESQ